MKLIKISGLIMVLACASATGKNIVENGDPILDYVKGSIGNEYRFESKRSFPDEYQNEVAGKIRIVRAVTDRTSSETLMNNNSSPAYYFDYVVRDPDRNLHFHMQKKYENGTVEGFYGHGEGHHHHVYGYDRYIVVTYVADAAGYRAVVNKEVSSGSLGMVGIDVDRIDGKLTFSIWAILSLVASADNLYTSGVDSKSDEDDDSYGSEEEEA